MSFYTVTTVPSCTKVGTTPLGVDAKKCFGDIFLLGEVDVMFLPRERFSSNSNLTRPEQFERVAW